MSQEFIWQAKDLTLGYGRQEILAEVDFAIRQGEFWFFLGPNGEGKSTLLKTILGALKPQKGSVQFAREFADKSSLGYVPQRCDLNPTLPTTVKEFVLLGLVGCKIKKSKEEKKLLRALEKVGLDDFAEKDYWSLSGGQRQRALVARALVREPKLLIADEPTNGLDVTSETQLLNGLHRLNRDEKVTVIFVTHQLSLAWRYATHVAIFHDGNVETGTRAEILTDKNLSRIYDLPLEDFHAVFGTVHI